MLAAMNMPAPADLFARPPEDELEGATAQERRHFLDAMCDTQGCSQDSQCHDAYCGQCGNEPADFDGLLASPGECSPAVVSKDTYSYTA
jgi:hypothetical protein